MIKCLECGGSVGAIDGELVCTDCGLVLGPIMEHGQSKAEARARHFPTYRTEGACGVLLRLAQALGLPSTECLELFRRLRQAGARVGEAVTVSLYVVAKRKGKYISLRRACQLCALGGVSVNYRSVLRAMLQHWRLVLPPPDEALHAVCNQLQVSAEVRRAALSILRCVRPFAGGRDPYLVALAAIYIAMGRAGSKPSYYALSKGSGRSVGRLYEHVNYLYALLDRGAGLGLGRKMRAIQLEIKK